jgi:hypothetical protein
MSLDDLVNPVTRLEDTGIAQPNFGIPLVVASLPSAVVTAWGPDLLRKYTSAAAAIADGLTATTRAGKLVAACFAQTPKPTEVWVGRRQTSQTQVITLVPPNTTAGFVYTGKVSGATSGTWTYTVAAAPNNTVPIIVAEIVDAINALAVTGCTAAAVGTPATHLTCTSTADLVLDYTNMSTALTVTDSTVDPSSATDLAAITAVDNGWYFLVTDCGSQAANEAVAAWCESAGRHQFIAQAADSACLTSATATNQCHTLNALSYYRTSVWWNQDISANLAPAITGSRATATPGSDTWHLKNLSGVMPSDQLSATQIGYLKAKCANYYITTGDKGRTRNGWVVGGEYCDVVRFLDWTDATMQIDCVNALAVAEKVPNTDEGRQVIANAIALTLEKGRKNGGWKTSPAPAAVMPKDTDATSFDAATRTLTGVSWSATLANAIHAVNPINGYVSN